ncbi:hypothetical protein [Aquabacterium sp.]|uniref:hypothetical protein n=1 Tax=Aquabacterium sp. TaxID=1872578 RepID=UPI003D6D97BB
MNRRLMACALSAMALHGAVLSWAMLWHRPSQTEANAALEQPMRVRIMYPNAQASPVQSVLSSEPEVSVPAPAEQRVLAVQQQTAVGGPFDVKSSLSGEGDMVEDDYVPRHRLTVVPRPTASIAVPFPQDFEDKARYKFTMNLYIEADGRVGRVEFEGAPLPDVLERAARTTFEHARFTPGQVNGRIVKSLIKIEVDFDNLAAS